MGVFCYVDENENLHMVYIFSSTPVVTLRIELRLGLDSMFGVILKFEKFIQYS